MKYKVLILSIAGLILTLNLLGQNRAVKFEEIEDLQASKTKPVVVLIMTSWCKYCHAMKNTMLKNKNVAAFLSSEYHTVFLNAEEKKDILFAGKLFKYKSGLNELALQLGSINGRVSYPTLTVLNSKNEIIFQHSGYLPPNGMMYLLKKALSNQ